MASTKRSTRRAEDPQRSQENQKHSHTAKHTHQIIATQTTRTQQQNVLQNCNSVRMKRPLDPIDSNFDSLTNKRARITVEILARPIPRAISPPKTVAVKPQSASNKPAVVTTKQAAQQQNQQTPLQSPPAQPAAAAAPTTATIPDPAITQHQKKVINGIRHELDRLQPSAADAGLATSRGQGRKLRSQEATRFKSELSAYFPDYDEVIGNDPKEHHILNIDTPIVVIDSKPRRLEYVRKTPSQHDSSATALQLSTNGDPELTKHHSNPHQDPPLSTFTDEEYPVRVYGDALFSDLFDSHRIDFTFFEGRHNDGNAVDPLPDSHYGPAHKKAERLEKSIRNTEKGRAQHEKDQIIRLLNDLQGPDWLRIMGVSGVTESRKKTFEPAREHFIKGCQAILEKFRLWSEEERKRKREKELARAEAEVSSEEEETTEEEEDEEGDEDEAEIDEGEDEDGTEDADMADAGSDAGINDGDPSDDSSVAQQLLEEALAIEKPATPKLSKRSRGGTPPASPKLDMVPEEFTSSFRKTHQRNAALNKNDRSRSAMAWGTEVPEPAREHSFDLPEEIRNDETVKVRERRTRRGGRASR